MTKLALISDTHFGVRQNSPILLDYNKLFLDEIFFPYLKENGITEVIHLGDLVDNRKHINFYTAKRLREDFIEPLLSKGITFRLILGNHDIHFKQDNEISVASELFTYYNEQLNQFPGNFLYYKDPEEVTFDGVPILFLPWICDSNKEISLELINTTTSQIVFGHLELKGFEMFKGVEASHGEDPKIYEKFDIVCTGHYHHRSTMGNINYLGSHSQFTWSDYGDIRGFHVFDTGSRSLNFIRNPFPIFSKVFYDDSSPEEIKKTDFENLTNKYVKVIVRTRNNSILYDWFLNQIEEAKPIEYKIVDDHLNQDVINNNVIISDVKDTLTLMLDYVKQVNTCSDDKLTMILSNLYHEAINIEN